MQKNRFEDKRNINLVRVSTNSQEGAGDQEQLMVATEFEKSNKMIHVDNYLSIGVSGSETFNRSDIDALLHRARTKRDFDTLLVHDLSRLTRGGPTHGANLHREFQRVGVEIVSVRDNVPDGPEGELMRSVHHYQNSMFPRQLAWRTMLGKLKSWSERRCAGSTHIPFGCDRLILGIDGKPVERLRIRRGIRHVLDPVTLAVRDTHYANDKGGMPRYRRMKEHVSMDIPGEQELVELVNWVFASHYLDGLGQCRIAYALNKQIKAGDQSKLPAISELWASCSIREMLQNPIYLGYSLGALTTSSKFYRMGRTTPQPALMDQAVLEGSGRKTMPIIRVPKDERLMRDEPQMAEFIANKRVRELAKKAVAKYWDGYYERAGINVLKTMKIPRDRRHTNSPYFLSGLLVNQYGCRYVGRSQYERSRRYHPAAAHWKWEVGHPARIAVLAEPLEAATLDILRHVFSQRNTIENAVRQYVKEELQIVDSTTTERKKIEAELHRRAGKLQMLLNMSDQLEPEQWRIALVKQREAVEKLRTRLISMTVARPIDPRLVFSNVAASLFPAKLPVTGERVEWLRYFLKHITRKLVLNTNTMELLFELAIPKWALTGQDALEGIFGYQSTFENEAESLPLLGIFRCRARKLSLKQGDWTYDWAEITPRRKAA